MPTVEIESCTGEKVLIRTLPDQSEILRWLGSFKKPPKKTFVIHGEPPASKALDAVLRDELKWNTEIPSIGQTVVLY
jgi:metallo-beta-lactamase family protein